MIGTSVVIAADGAPLNGELTISAATAHAHGARLYSRIPANFRGLDDHLEVITV